MKLKITLGLFLIFLVAGISEAWATHIRAGEITAERVSPQTLEYVITVVGYTDTRSTVIFGPGTINFGDGRIVDGLNTESEFGFVENVGN